jgi:hypothetical protein
MRIAIGIPTTGTIKTPTVESIIAMIGQTEGEVHFFTRSGCYIHENRRELVKEAKMINADYLFFFDSDMIAPPDTINKLISHNKMIVGTNPNLRSLPLEGTVKFIENGKVVKKEIPEKLFQCSALGTACLLIDMRVFNMIDKPWFWFEDLGKDDFIGEDIWFCRQAERKGIEIYCDPLIKVGHIGDYIY